MDNFSPQTNNVSFALDIDSVEGQRKLLKNYSYSLALKGDSQHKTQQPTIDKKLATPLADDYDCGQGMIQGQETEEKVAPHLLNMIFRSRCRFLFSLFRLLVLGCCPLGEARVIRDILPRQGGIAIKSRTSAQLRTGQDAWNGTQQFLPHS